MEYLNEELTNPLLRRYKAFEAGLFDPDRNKRWVDCSHCLAPFSPWAVVTLQNLGALDARLILEDAELVKTGLPKTPTNDLSAHITDSYLWVLGMYELVRTVSQASKIASAPLHSMLEAINYYKKKINRLRVPLAKMEAAGSNKEDSPIAFPGLNLEHGITWQLGENVWITRRELSDEALSLFTSISQSINTPKDK